MTLPTKLLLGTIIVAFAAFHAVTWYNVAPLLAAARTESAAMLRSD
jgi:fumarate reductase subunit C